MSLPQHIAFIMDGNGRWAQARGLPRLEGHRQGVEAVRRMIEAAAASNIPYVTFYAFSTENWKRPADEVHGLMGLFKVFIERELARLAADGVRLRFLGDRGEASKLPADVRALMDKAEAATAANSRINASFCLNYGGRAEIVAAAKNIAADAAAGRLNPHEVDEATFASRLYTAGLPDPDLCIRTSGEQRLSNFLLWQLAYAELLFVPQHWPDMDETTLAAALSQFGGRERRFGAVLVAAGVKG